LLFLLLFLLFRHYGMSFYAYSPLGGGILTGKYAFEQEKEKSITTGRNGIVRISFRNKAFLYKFLLQNKKRCKICTYR
jgi:aryl-alcohol dehydrogenase-like predicted oxidoreductase